MDGIEKEGSRFSKIMRIKETDKFSEKIKWIISTLENKSIVAFIDILRIMGYESEANMYRDDYINVLARTINYIAKNCKDSTISIYHNEKNAIDGILSVLKEENQLLIKIMQELKS